MLNVGIIQMQSLPLQVEANLQTATGYIAKVVAQGAKLVVLPEMFNVGFYFGADLMTVAETLDDSPTIRWLKEQATTHHIYIVTCIYEKYKGHFYNTMVLVEEDGQLQYYRKRNPTGLEWAVWRRSNVPGPGIFDTPIGRIGGVICFDSFARETFEGFQQSAVDIVVIGACWGGFAPISKRPDVGLMRPTITKWSNLASEVVPKQYSERLKVPTVFVNQGGCVETPCLMPQYLPAPNVETATYQFQGRSSIRDADGTILAQATSNEVDFWAVKPVSVSPQPTYPPIKRVDIPPQYLNKDYFFVVPPFLARLYQAWSTWGFDRDYEQGRQKFS